MEMARNIAEIMYPKEEGWRHAWVFNHSSCHAAIADDELDASKMNVGPGGKQRIMRDTVWNGRKCELYFMERGGRKVVKGLKMVLEERRVLTLGKTAEWMRKTLGEHADFTEIKRVWWKQSLFRKDTSLVFFCQSSTQC